jgi:hypothetical protein
MAKSSSDLQAWARLGARQRLRDINEERVKILATFPDLRGGTTSQRSTGAPTGRKRRRMSADARRRISEAQKARWAKQKAAAKKKGAKAA